MKEVDSDRIEIICVSECLCLLSVLSSFPSNFIRQEFRVNCVECIDYFPSARVYYMRIKNNNIRSNNKNVELLCNLNAELSADRITICVEEKILKVLTKFCMENFQFLVKL